MTEAVSLVFARMDRLEPLCAAASGGDVPVPATPGVERMRAFFYGRAFGPHRHDTYAVGVTLHGVQCFDYRGEARRSGQGQAFVLHPDERHDGHAADERGFGYHIAYVDPALLRQAVGGGGPLPFVRDPVSDDRRLRVAIGAMVDGSDPMGDELGACGRLAALADALHAAAGEITRAPGRIDERALARARDALGASRRVSMAEIEAVCSLSRWELARQFRLAFGVSPSRYHLLRRIDHARDLILRAVPLAEVALATGFADQAHLTRHFHGAVGMPPGRWRALVTERAKRRLDAQLTIS